MKKFFIVLAVAGALAVTPCFAGGTKETSASGPAAPAAAKVSLQFLNIGPTSDVKNLFEQKLIPAFQQKYPNLSVDMSETDWGSAFQKVTTGIAAGTAPDVMVIGGIWVAPLASKGGLLPLDSYVNTMADKSDIYSAAWKDTEYDGHIYAVPWNLDVRTLVYRKDLFQAAGLDPNKPPTTWSEYLSDAKKLTKFQSGQMVQAGTLIGLDNSIGVQQYFAQLFFQAGGSYYTPDGKANFDSPAGHAAMNFLKKLIDEKVTSPDFSGVGALQNARVYNPKIVDQIAFGKPLAMDQSSKPTTVVWVNKIAIFKGTAHPDDAWKFASFVASPEWESQWARLVGNLPTRQSVASSEPWSSEATTQSLLSNMQFATVQPANPHMFEIPQIIKSVLMDVIYNKVTPDDALKQMNQKINAVLAQ